MYNILGDIMKENCNDVFAEYNLPLETFFVSCQNHELTTHNDLEIIWVLKGKAFLEVENQKHEMTDQTVFLVYQNKRHALKVELGSVIIAYRLKNDYLHRRGLFFEKIPYQGKVFTFDFLADKYRQVPLLLVQFMKILLSNEKKEIIYYKILAYYNFYIAEIYQMLLKERYLDIKTIDYDEFLLRSQIIVDFVYSNFFHQITLTDLKKEIGLSNSRISHFIKEFLGISFQEFLQIVRLEHAIKLLKNTKLPINEISKQSGFSDHKYLNQLLKKHYNTTALKYRKGLQKPNIQINSFKKSNEDYIQEIKNCLVKLEDNPRFKKLFTIEPLENVI